MSPEIALFLPRARIIEINPPKVEPPSSFKREEPIIDVQFIPKKPPINYFHLKAASEYRKTVAWFSKPKPEEVIVLNKPLNKKEAALESIKRLVQKIGLDRVFAWLRNIFWPQKAYQTIFSAIS